MEYHFWIAIKIIFCVVIFWTLYTIVRFNIFINRGGESVAFEQSIPHATEHILVAGDSTGFGVGTTKSEDSTAGRLGALFPRADIRNISVSGDRVEDTLTLFRSLAPTDIFDLILLQVGANDITHRTSLYKLESELRDLLDLAKAKSKQVIILHSGDVGTAPIFPQPIEWYLGRQSRKVRDVYVRVTAEKKVTYVDLLQEGADDIFLQDIPRYYSADRFHPSGEGYRIWFEKIEKVLIPLF